MTTSPEPNQSVALALADMGRKLEVGLTRIDGQLALLVQRHDQSDQKIADIEKRLDAVERGETERQKRNETRVDGLERSRWPLPSLAALVGLVGLVLALYQLWNKP